MTKTTLKSAAEIALMDEANRIIRGILTDLRSFILPGVSTIEVDCFAERKIAYRIIIINLVGQNIDDEV